MNSSFTFLKHELHIEQGSASFFYRAEHNGKTYDFTETISFPINKMILDSRFMIHDSILDDLLLILGISYWKAFCPKEIKTPTIHLSKDQAAFWNIVYTKGLGEFFYKNNIDYRGLIQFPYTPVILNAPPAGGEGSRHFENRDSSHDAQNDNKKSLLLFGGGKDSIVSTELLKKHNKPCTLFIVNPTPIHLAAAEQTGIEVISFTRTIDPQLFVLNKQEGIYNGHIPATAIIDFLALFAGTIYGYSYVIGSNEKSANYGNVGYLGEEMNHQWSKSEEFEVLLQQYLSTRTSAVSYFSLLRPWHEIRIVKEFINFPQYFPIFTSCNRNFKIQNTKYQIRDTRIWCGECPKCLFVFILLAAFLPREQLLSIFNKNLFDDYSLLPILRELLGLSMNKPFECVGTPSETIFALLLAFQSGQYANDLLVIYFATEILPTLKNEKTLMHLLSTAKSNTMPEEFVHILPS